MILRYKQFKESINLKVNKWVDVDLNDVDDIMGNYIWNMYTETYLKQKMDLSADNWHDMKGKYKATFLIDVDNDKIPDAFIIHKKTKFGNKLALMATNGKKEAKRELVVKLINLLNERGWYIEASKKMEEIFSKTNINVVRDSDDIKSIIPNAININKDGYYERVLSKVDKIIIKRIYGNPIL